MAVMVMRLLPAPSVMAGVVQLFVPPATPFAPPKTLQFTWVITVRVSVAVPLSVMELALVLKVVAVVGPVIVTEGASGSYVTEIESTFVFPAVSVAVTLMVLTPFTSVIEGTDQVPPAGAKLLVWPLAVFTHRMFATPMLSEYVPASVVRGL